MSQFDFFDTAYDQKAWTKTLGRLFGNKFALFASPLHLDIENKDVAAFDFIGHIKLDGGTDEIGIYEIKAKPHTQLYRNRVHLRTVVAKAARRQGQNGALAVYYEDDNPQWRLSFVNIESETDSRRFTFLLGEGTQTRTVKERFTVLAESKPPSFEGIKEAFSVEPLNREFYNKIYGWYERAKEKVVFPNDEHVGADEHTATSLIRLLTRLLFVWFIKEKGLVDPQLFNRQHLESVIQLDKPSSFYKAILQNLFFATLNVEIDKRDFRTEKRHQGKNKHYGNQFVHRYHALVQDLPTWKALFEKTPFLNGGLFECLDREATDEEQKAHEADKKIRRESAMIRIDGFSDRNLVTVPNELFFNEALDSLGLIDILEQYQFTIEESTPLEVEVALDPELLGKVFENLLASYNPETQETARNSTGSFYTPREIVAYMVDESLKGYFKQALAGVIDMDKRIDALFYEHENQFSPAQTTQLIHAIDELRVLDPAVGSGAFPMSILQRLVDLLKCLDPKNEQFKQRQIDKAEKIADRESRVTSIKSIEAVFSRKNDYNSYGYKLYLIENCVYGADIQLIAIQIAKLRFFISLAIEQEATKSEKQNYGIRPLPNLETKFVAANSLIRVTPPNKKVSNGNHVCEQTPLRNGDLAAKEEELRGVRQRYFNAQTPEEKSKLKDDDERVRTELLTTHPDFDTLTGERIAKWDPYKPDTVAEWFEPEWMFGVAKGFDVVIGNPPYIQLHSMSIDARTRQQYMEQAFTAYDSSGDIYCLFYEKGLKLAKAKTGLLAYITSNKWMRAGYGENLRGLFSRKNPLQLLDLGADMFENAVVDTNILLIQNGDNQNRLQATSFKEDFKAMEDIQAYIDANHVILTDLTSEPWFIANKAVVALKKKIEKAGKPLKEWGLNMRRGIITGYNAAFIITQSQRDALIAADPNSKKIIHPVFRGRDIKRFHADWAELYLINTHNGYGNTPPVDIEKYPAVKAYLKGCYRRLKNRQDKGITPFNLRSCAYLKEFAKEKLVWSDISTSPNFSLLEKNKYIANTAYMITSNDNKYLLAVLNSSVTGFYFPLIASSLGEHGTRYFKDFVEEIPIPKISAAKQKPLITLVDKILATKAADKSADIGGLAADLDKLVYSLYGLTAKDIKTIEESQT